jgi:Glycosyl hydrolases family 8
MKYLYVILILPQLLFSQVAPNINSGNPAFPFPQFAAYEYAGGHKLDNLANKNPDGLTHAEMEKRIREAWLIMSNAFVYDAETYAGVKYIKSNIGCPYDCTEGVGYAMIAAAYMGDKTIFDGIWFREHDIRMIKKPRYRDGVIPNSNYQYGDNSLKDNGDSAADGDFDVALITYGMETMG